MKMLRSLHPNYNWLSWKFHPLPVGYWDEVENREQYFRWLEGELNIENPEDWYEISTFQILQADGNSYLKYKGNFLRIFNGNFKSITIF
jgi:hypothetical protein